MRRPAAPGLRRRRGRPDARREGLPLPTACVTAAVAGILYAAAFPAAGVWPLALVGVGLLLAALRGRTFLAGMLVGGIWAACSWLLLIDWVALFLGPVPLVALTGLESALTALGPGLTALAYRSIPALLPGTAGRLLVTPLVVAATWTAREVVAGTWPYGGFTWGRLAFSQADSPYAPIASWVGSAGFGFVLVWLVAFVLALTTAIPRPGRPLLQAVGLRVLPAVAATGLLAAVPLFRLPTSGAIRVAAVQPNTHAGYFDPANDPTANLDTVAELTETIPTGTIDLVVWPEGAAQFDPLRDTSLQARLDRLAAQVGAPLLTGAITDRAGRFYNSSLLWQSGRGATGLYDKVRPVPFGEYVPDRGFWTRIAPTLLAQVGRDYQIGDRSPVLQIGAARAGVSICFDIVDDGLILGAVAEDPGLLIAQTNNADFGTTDQHLQQLAIARIRAIETGRPLLAASTVASTAAIAPDGRLLAAAAPFTSQVLTVRLPLVTGTTPAAVLGIPLAVILTVLGIAIPVAARLRLTRPARRHPTSGAGHHAPDSRAASGSSARVSEQPTSADDARTALR